MGVARESNVSILYNIFFELLLIVCAIEHS